MMKNFWNSLLFLLLFLCIIGKDSISGLLIKNIPEPIYDEALKSSLKTKEEELFRLEKNFDIDYPYPEKQIYSKLLCQNPFTFFANITILKGSKEGIESKFAVMNQDGLVGITETIHDHSSTVNLLTHKDTKLSVKIRNSFGILTSNERNELWIKDLTNKEELMIGDEIITSGLTEIPANLYVGTIEEIKKDELGLIQMVKVKLGVNYNDLSYFVVLGCADHE